MRDHALERRIAEALAADPRVDDDTIAVECGESGYVVLRGSAVGPSKDNARCGRLPRSAVSTG
jgi:hypothetical protein